MDPWDDRDGTGDSVLREHFADSVLREHFAALHTDTLARVRPPGALAARRGYRARVRWRLVAGAAAMVLAVAGAGGGYALAGRHTPSRSTATAHTGPAVPVARPPVASAGPGPSRGASPTPTGTGTSPSPSANGLAGGPVPAGFRAESITFISTSSSWALGYAPCLVPRPWSECPAVVRSRDGGRTWVGVPAPGDAAYLGDIRFASARDGWIVARAPVVAKDPGGVSGVLYATHDGGGTWHEVGSVPDPVAVEAAAGRVWVTTGAGADAAHAVYSAPIGGDSFTWVASTSGTGLVVHGPSAYAYGAGTDLVAVAGGAVSRRTLPCAEDHRAGAVLAASSELDLAVVCAGTPADSAQPKQAFTSSDGGRTWTATTGAPDSGGYVTSLAATGSAVFLSGQGMPVRVTRDAGASWPAALTAPTPDGFSYVGFTDTRHGVALALAPSPTIYLSTDAGKTWTPRELG